MKKYALLTTIAMIFATAQPVMASTPTPDQLDQLFLSVGLPIA